MTATVVATAAVPHGITRHESAAMRSVGARSDTLRVHADGRARNCKTFIAGSIPAVASGVGFREVGQEAADRPEQVNDRRGAGQPSTFLVDILVLGTLAANVLYANHENHRARTAVNQKTCPRLAERR